MHSKPVDYVLSFIAVAVAVFAIAAPSAAQPRKPNILIIWRHDIGYWNVSAYNQMLDKVKELGLDERRQHVFVAEYVVEHGAGLDDAGPADRRGHAVAAFPALLAVPGLDFVDDKEAKPLAIQQYIGRRPIAAFGNSDGNLQMLQWTADGQGPRFCLYVHHTDAERNGRTTAHRSSVISTRASTKRRPAAGPSWT